MKNLFLIAVLLLSFGTASAQTDKKAKSTTATSKSDQKDKSTMTQDPNGNTAIQPTTSSANTKKGKVTNADPATPAQSINGTPTPNATGTTTTDRTGTTSSPSGMEPATIGTTGATPK